MVRALGIAPARPFLAARERFDRTLRDGNEATRAPALLRLARLRPVPRDIRVFTPPGRPDVRFVNGSSGVTQWTFWLGMDEVARLGSGPRVWEALCANAREIVEIGANIGFYTVPGGAAAKGTYRAYEPHPESAAALRANLLENGAANVEVHQVAVVPDSGGPVQLAIPPSDTVTPGGASLVPEFRVGSTVSVQGVPVADVLGSCDLLKLDVEGLEAALFRAGWDALVRLRPTIMVEVHDTNRELRSLLPQLLAETDASVFAMRRASLVPVPNELMGDGVLFDSFGTWDYLLVPRDRRDGVDRLPLQREAAR